MIAYRMISKMSSFFCTWHISAVSSCCSPLLNHFLHKKWKAAAFWLCLFNIISLELLSQKQTGSTVGIYSSYQTLNNNKTLSVVVGERFTVFPTFQLPCAAVLWPNSILKWLSKERCIFNAILDRQGSRNMAQVKKYWNSTSSGRTWGEMIQTWWTTV